MYHVTLYINPAAFGQPGPIVEAVTFDIDEASIDSALNIAYAVGNSYPEEMFCPERYGEAVHRYRAGKNRSLSVGDYVRLQDGDYDRWHQVASFGFDPAEPQRLAEQPSEQQPATSAAHPFQRGTRVRHDGRRWSLAPFATVVDVKPQRDGTFEYLVQVDDDSKWITAGEQTWWASYHTWGMAPETDDFTPSSVSDASGRVTLHWLEPTLMRCDGPAGSQEHRFTNPTDAAAVWLAFCCK